MTATIDPQHLSDPALRTELEICLALNKRLAGKNSRTARLEAANNAERFGKVTSELKRRGIDVA